MVSAIYNLNINIGGMVDRFHIVLFLKHLISANVHNKNKMCLWNTMPPIMDNSNEGQDHKDKYFDTSRKILSQEMIMYNMEAFSILSLRSYDQCQFFLIGQMSRSKD